LFPHGVLAPLTGLPLVVRVVPGLGLSGAGVVSIAVRVVELLLGLALVASATVRRRRRPILA
jgi:Na+-driven multidrug efflux pump